MAEEDDPDAPLGCRQEAIAAFNRAWQLIDFADRSLADDDEMLAAAFTSRYLWDSIGGDEQRAVGDWQIAHVASLLGYAGLALSRAERALERVVRNGWTDWQLASCYEGMARAHAAAGNLAQRDHWAALSREVIDTLEDEEDRELIASQLASVPGVTSPGGGQDARPGHRVVRLDHVQVAMPAGMEAEAEAFYGGILGLEVRPKPPVLARRGGCWFENQEVRVHLGVEPGFRPAGKAHPALVIERLDSLVEALADGGHPVTWDKELTGVRRCYVADPFGNRIELIEA
jgi:catechol 2,3-dioxygenase-like lactoylglutathione lyase family enzyme